jgi:hypothetical protein
MLDDLWDQSEMPPEKLEFLLKEALCNEADRPTAAYCGLFDCFR